MTATIPFHVPPANPVIVDVSDVCLHLNNGLALGGIVRVITQIIRHTDWREGRGGVTLVFFHPAQHRYVRLDPALFADDRCLDRHHFNRATGMTGIRMKTASRRYMDRPLRRAWHLFRRGLKRRIRAVGEYLVPPRGVLGWAISPWTMPSEGRCVVAVLGMAWLLPEQIARLRALASRPGVEVVPLIHDLIPIVAPASEPKPNLAFVHWFGEMASLANRYVTISHHSAADIRGVLGSRSGQPPRIDRVPLAHSFDWDGHVDPSLVPDGEYVLSVGSIAHARKNLLALIDVWGRIGARIGTERLPTLVIAGDHDGKARQIDELLQRHPMLRERLRLVRKPSDQQLAALYSACLFSIFPSLYEGWGLPLGESASFGRLCLSSRVTSLSEVLGEAIDYFDPTSLDDMISCIERPILDRAYLKRREEGLRTLPLRSWRMVARELFATLAQHENAIELVGAGPGAGPFHAVPVAQTATSLAG
ncbi:glycosyltransferase [Ancylobacter sp. 6x-1]|uniref:Glycosyltransferase n=1 Tax=Ancylobacter crimeensis TaxID=2579147 RepID=A0ABT0DCV6_9HYPH|nr:glycosyltransferase [Ancylobacter crimeensis]MCK0197800.1 glycosyltransferase [Ancylobacter crimeensis]